MSCLVRTQSRAREKLLLTKRRCRKFQLVCLRCSSQRRPDIERQNNNFRAASAGSVSRWRFLPRIGLTALYGGVSTELSALTSGGANASSLETTATDLFSKGVASGSLFTKLSLAEGARLAYHTALNALREVLTPWLSREST